MNLHIAQDSKFLDNFIKNEREFTETDNKYLIFTWTKSQEVEKVKSDGIHVAKWNSRKFWEIIGDASQYANVYFHYLLPRYIHLIKKFPAGVKFIWIFWGGDGFGHPELDRDFLLPETRNLYESKYKGLFNNLRPLLKLYKYLFRNKISKDWKRTIRAMDYFAHYIHEDFEIIRAQFDCKAKFVNFTYGYARDYGGDCEAIPSFSKNILLGNSAGSTNNHLDIINILSRRIPPDVSIYCPFSYGSLGNAYTSAVKLSGEKLLGKRFILLTEYLSLEDYHKIINSCGIVIMPQLRSQGLGNVLAALSMGKKVFFFSKNTLFRLLKRQGFTVFSIEEDLQHLDFSRLPDDDLRNNRHRLEMYYGVEVIRKWYNELLEI